MNKLKKVLITVAALAALALGGAALAGASPNDVTGGDELSGSTLDRASKAALAETGGGKVTDSERDGENGATYEVEVTKDDGSQVDVRLDDQLQGRRGRARPRRPGRGRQPRPGADRRDARPRVEGRAGEDRRRQGHRLRADTEHGATYEIEVTKADGSQVDVRLDDQFKVVAAEADHED